MMDKKTRYAVLVVAIIVIVGSILSIENIFSGGDTGIIDTGKGQAGTEVGQLAPDFELESFEGERIKFSDFSGKGLVINAWAGWCPFCIDEMPDLQKASNNHGDQVIVLFIHRTRTEPIEIGQKFLDGFPETRGIEITDPVLMDPKDDFYNTFFGFGMPVTLFLDGDGIIRDKKVGPLTVNEIEDKIQKIL